MAYRVHGIDRGFIHGRCLATVVSGAPITHSSERRHTPNEVYILTIFITYTSDGHNFTPDIPTLRAVGSVPSPQQNSGFTLSGLGGV